jgi:hypothetical protein
MIAKKLEWEPYGSGTPKAWGASGLFGDRYWADDNGLWHSNPDQSGPDPRQAKEAQAQEDSKLLESLSPEAQQALRDAGLLTTT